MFYKEIKTAWQAGKEGRAMKRLLLLIFLICIPWIVVLGFNVGLNMANTVFQKPVVWFLHTETVWKITVVWASAVIAVLTAKLAAARPNESA